MYKLFKCFNYLHVQVKEKTLVEALTQKRATAGDETVVMNYRMHDVRLMHSSYKFLVLIFIPSIERVMGMQVDV